MKETKIYSVTELNKYIKSLINKEDSLKKIQINGELASVKSSVTQNNFKIYYFLVTDTKKSTIRAVMWGNKLKFEPHVGDQVLIMGDVNIYEKNCDCQIQIEEMTPYGEGERLLALKMLKEKLRKEGLFRSSQPELQRPINLYPKAIGLITAENSAAYQDFVTSIFKRYPLVKIYFFPSLVQGEKAAEDLINALKKAYKYCLDTIIIGRGGGSNEDLNVFNNEQLARIAFDSPYPIVSAVGHDIDHTILDLVADYRAITPTDAAKIVVIDKNDIRKTLNNLQKNIKTILSYKIDSLKIKIESLKKHPIFANPRYIYQETYKKIELKKIELKTIINSYFDKYKHQLELKKTKLQNINPRKILQRGFALLKKQNGQIIKDVKNVDIHEKIEATLYEGTLYANIIEKRSK